MRVFRPTSLAVSTLLVSIFLSGCSSSFFKITKEGNGAPPVPASAPRVDPAVSTLPPATDSASARAGVDAAPVATPIVAPEPPAEASDSAGIERLVQLAQLWSAVAQFHPHVATRGVPWDSAVVRTVERVRASRDADGMRAAIEAMLAVLGDPATRFVSSQPADQPTMPRPVSSYVTSDSVLVVTAPIDALVRDDNAVQQLAQVAGYAGTLPRIVIDLRASRALDTASARRAVSAFDESGIAAALTPRTLLQPGERRRVVGAMYVDDAPSHFAIGESPAAWRVESPSWLRGTGPALTTPAPRQRRNRPPLAPLPLERRIVVIANEHTAWPKSVTALLANGRASLFAEGSASDAHSVATARLPLRGVGDVALRLGELVGADGQAAVRVDSQFAPSAATDSSAPVVAAALAAVRSGRLPQRALHVELTPARLPAAYDTATYPTIGARVLGVFRLWSAMQTLHAQRDAYDSELGEAFRDAIGKAEAARDARAYADALRALAAAGDDSGMRLRGAAFERAIGERALPVRVRWIEGRAMVVAVADDSSARASGLAVGDEITSMEGYPASAWATEYRRAVLASNEWTRLDALADVARRGPPGSRALLKVRDARGTERSIELPRTLRYDDSSAFPVRARAFSYTAPGGVRYIDATATGDAAAAMPAEARAVLLDLRGVVSDAGARVAQQLLPAHTIPIARVVRRGASRPCVAATLRAAQMECIDERATETMYSEPNASVNFDGMIVLLVDERTDRRGEMLALALEAAGARVLGSPTAGSLASPSWLSLPGHLQVGLPLEEVRRADGGQLHRVGLSPLVELQPTVRGLRGGTDDVLDRALQWVQQELAPPVRRRR